MGKTSERTTKLLRTTGNALIGLSVVGVLLTFYPIAREELAYKTRAFSEKPISQEFNVMVKSIKVNAPVTKNVDPWNQSQYLPALHNGIAHAKGSSLPDEEGSVYLFAHSSDAPWRMTSYNTAFFRLGRVNEGDEIIVTYEGKDYGYRVSGKSVVWPNEVEYLTGQERNQLILQTCTPIGTAFKRLLVFADPIDNN